MRAESLSRYLRTESLLLSFARSFVVIPQGSAPALALAFAFFLSARKYLLLLLHLPLLSSCQLASICFCFRTCLHFFVVIPQGSASAFLLVVILSAAKNPCISFEAPSSPPLH
jgi:hypothetical protein